MRKNGHYDKANDKDNIEIFANTNTLKSEMISIITSRLISGDVIPLIVSSDLIVNSTHQDLMSLKIWLIFLLSTAY